MSGHAGADDTRAGDDRLVVTDDVRVPAFELTETFTASGGPGGQHANKAATRVELRFHVPTSSAFRRAEDRQRVLERLGETIVVVVDDERSQHRNRELARRRLVERLRAALRPSRPRRPTRPTRGADRRRLRAKSERSETKRLRRRPGVDD